MPSLELEALDDAAPRASSFVEVPLDRATDVPTLPSDIATFIARGRTRDGALAALGVLAVEGGAAHGPLFRTSTACAFRDAAGARASFPELRSPSSASSARYALLAGGRDGDGSARSDLLVIDSERGVATRLGFRRRRSDAAAAIVADRAIVAGGSAGSELWEDAEVIALDRSEVLAEPIRLSEKRAAAAMVTLANGEVLLVGGRGSSGALSTLEALAPNRPIARTLDLASLARPRISPIVLRLATGELVVLGGVDDGGAPVNDVDVFDATASKRLATLPFVRRASLSAVALPSGAALAVSSDDAGASAVLIRADAIEALPDPRKSGRPRLIDATDGAPFLFDGTFHRFDPFAGTFVDVALPSNLLVDDALPPFGLAHGVLAVPRIEGSSVVVRALRYDVRPPLVSDAGTLGLGSTAHLSPDRRGVVLGRDGLVMPPRSRVAVTDATFAGMSLRISATGRDRPAIELRGDGLLIRVDDSGTCAWPPGESPVSEIVRERDGEVIVRVGAAERRCGKLGTARVSVTLVAGTAEARVRGVSISRR